MRRGRSRVKKEEEAVVSLIPVPSEEEITRKTKHERKGRRTAIIPLIDPVSNPKRIPPKAAKAGGREGEGGTRREGQRVRPSSRRTRGKINSPEMSSATVIEPDLIPPPDLEGPPAWERERERNQ